MASLRRRAPTALTLLAVFALCFSLQQAPPLSAKDKASSGKAAVSANDASDSSAASGDAGTTEVKSAKSNKKKPSSDSSKKGKKGTANADGSLAAPDSGNSSGGGVGSFAQGSQSNGSASGSTSPSVGKPASQGQGGQGLGTVVASPQPGSGARGRRPAGPGARPQAALPATGPNLDIVKKVMAIQNRNHAALVAQKGIAATGTGLDEDGNVVIKVYTTGADSPTVPKQIENIPVLEVLTGPLHLLQAPVATPLRQQRLPRATPIGTSAFDDVDLSATSCAAGTLGCRLHDNHGNIFALSNNHVFAGENLTQGGVQIGTPVVQPSPGDNNCTIGILPDQLGPLVAFVPVDLTTTGSNLIDCAIIQTTAQLVNTSTLLDGYGVPTSQTVPAFLGQQVQKYGRTSGYTRGTVTALNVAFPIAYANGTANFVGQIEVTGVGVPSFGIPGDSGSLVVDMNRNPVSLLFAGGGGLTETNPIDDVLKGLGLQLNATPGFASDTVLTIDSSPATTIGKNGRANPNSP